MLRKLSLSLGAQTQWRRDVCGATKEMRSLCLAGADRIPEAPVQAAPEGRGWGWGFTGKGQESLPLRRQVWPPVDWSGLCVPAQQS